MPKYDIQVYILASASATVEADSKKDAREKALELDWGKERLLIDSVQGIEIEEVKK